MTMKRSGEVVETYATCTCRCHDGDAHPLRCLTCNQPGQTMEHGHCVDTETCNARVAATLDADPLMQKLRASKEHGRKARALANDTDPEAPNRVKRAPRNRVGVCEHCGEPTKGGRFVAGHDAKLKGDLKRAAEQGDVEALVELYVRDWPVKNVKADQPTTDAARTAYNGITKSATWLAARNLQRSGQ
jgi:hypothetical protein